MRHGIDAKGCGGTSEVASLWVMAGSEDVRASISELAKDRSSLSDEGSVSRPSSSCKDCEH